jgi:hypothetical protein
MMDPGAQLHPLHGHFDQMGAGLVQRTKLPNLGRSHPTGRLRTIGVGFEICPFEPLSLNGAGSIHPFSYFGTWFAGAFVVAEFVKRYPRHFHMDVDPVKNGPDIFFGSF